MPESQPSAARALASGIRIGDHYLETMEDVLILFVFAAVMMLLAVWIFESQE